MSDDTRTAQEDYLSDAEIIRAVAWLRFPCDDDTDLPGNPARGPKERQRFCEAYTRVAYARSAEPRRDPAWHPSTGEPEPEPWPAPGTLVITPEEGERLSMLLYARHLVELAEAEFAKAPRPEPRRFIDPTTGEEEPPPPDYHPPTVEEERARVADEIDQYRRRVWPYGRHELFPTLPDFDEDLDDQESFQWHVSYIYAAELLDRGKRALDMLALDEWDHARVILLRARVLELEIEKRWLQIHEHEHGAPGTFRPGRKPGAVGEWGRIIMEILRSNTKMPAADVRTALLNAGVTCKGDRFFLRVGHRGTKWSSLEARLPCWRHQVRREQEKQQPVN